MRVRRGRPGDKRHHTLGRQGLYASEETWLQCQKPSTRQWGQGALLEGWAWMHCQSIIGVYCEMFTITKLINT